MEARVFKYAQDAAIVTEWGLVHKFPFPPKHLLSDIGFVVDDCACGFLYSTNSSFGWIEWVFTNSKRSKEDREKALDILFKLLEETAKNMGMSALFSASSVPRYSEILEKNQFQLTDKGMSHYLKLLGD